MGSRRLSFASTLLIFNALISGCSSSGKNQGPGAIVGKVEVSQGSVSTTCEVFVLGTVLNTRCDSNGQFVFPKVPPGHWKIQFLSEPATATNKQSLLTNKLTASVSSNQTTNLQTVFLAKPGLVSGHIFQNGAAADPGLLQVSVVAVSNTGELAQPSVSGDYLLELVPPGSQRIVLIVPEKGTVVQDPVTVESQKVTFKINFDLKDATNNPATLKGLAQRAYSPGSQAGITVRLVKEQGSAVVASAVTDSGGNFSFNSVDPGAYVIQGEDPGNPLIATLPGIVLASGEVRVLDIILTLIKPSDVITGGDGGYPFDYSDGGTPAVCVKDSDCPGSYCNNKLCGLCRTPADCSSGQWCDTFAGGACKPLCTSNTECTSEGKVCDVSSGTCQLPCSAGCPAGTACDPKANICRATCNIKAPCPDHQICGVTDFECHPECINNNDCAGKGVNFVCQAGACVSNGSCTTDNDCPASKQCAFSNGVGNCVVRPGYNGQGYACTRLCDCRQGELCGPSSLCVPDLLTWPDDQTTFQLVPKQFVAPGGTGDGKSPGTATADLRSALSTAKSGDTIALVETASADVGLATDGGVLSLSNVAVAGGYISCAPNRWMRDTDPTTGYSHFNFVGTLGGNGNNGNPPEPGAIQIGGPSSSAHVAVTDLKAQWTACGSGNTNCASAGYGSYGAVVSAQNVAGLSVSNLDIDFNSFDAGTSGNGPNSTTAFSEGVVAAKSPKLSISNIYSDNPLISAGNGNPDGSGISLVKIVTSSGTIDRVWTRGDFIFPNSAGNSIVSADQSTGDLSITRVQTGSPTAGTPDRMTGGGAGIRVTRTSSGHVSITNNYIRLAAYPSQAQFPNPWYGIQIGQSPDVLVDTNTISGAGDNGTYRSNIGVYFDHASGKITNNTFLFPNDNEFSSQATACGGLPALRAVVVNAQNLSDIEVAKNSGSGGAGHAWFLHVLNINSGNQVNAHNNVFSISGDGTAVVAQNVGSQGLPGLVLTDNNFTFGNSIFSSPSVEGISSCGSNTLGSVRAERNTFNLAPNAGVPSIGVNAFGTLFELYENYFQQSSSGSTIGFHLSDDSPFRAIGNTLSISGSGGGYGLQCDSTNTPSSPTSTLYSNIFFLNSPSVNSWFIKAQDGGSNSGKYPCAASGDFKNNAFGFLSGENPYSNDSMGDGGFYSHDNILNIPTGNSNHVGGSSTNCFGTNATPQILSNSLCAGGGLPGPQDRQGNPIQSNLKGTVLPNPPNIGAL